jgi:hypothetical protein
MLCIRIRCTYDTNIEIIQPLIQELTARFGVYLEQRICTHVRKKCLFLARTYLIKN